MTALIGSDFVWEVNTRTTRCGECHRYLYKGGKALVSRKDGKIRKRVCSEECRLAFDDHFWQMAAMTNMRKKGLQ